MSQKRHVVRPKATNDLQEQALYYACEAGAEMGHRFLESAEKTFSLLASQPLMGWNPKFKNPGLHSLRVFRVSRFPKILILYLPTQNGIEVLRVVHGSRNLQAWLSANSLE